MTATRPTEGVPMDAAAVEALTHWIDNRDAEVARLETRVALLEARIKRASKVAQNGLDVDTHDLHDILNCLSGEEERQRAIWEGARRAGWTEEVR